MSKCKNFIASVAVSEALYEYDKLYDYSIPMTEIQENAGVGVRVLVPFGHGNRKRVALILELTQIETVPQNLKPIILFIDKKPVISPEMVEMVFWLKETTFCTFFEAFKTIIPVGLHANFKQHYALTKGKACDVIAELTDEEVKLYDFLVASTSKKDFDNLLDVKSSPEKKKIVKSLLDKGFINELNDVKVRDESVTMVRFSDEYVANKMKYKLSTKQKNIVDLIEDCESASIKEVCYICNASPVTIKNLCAKGILTSFQYESEYNVDTDKVELLSEITLSQIQNQVFEGLVGDVDKHLPLGALLYGITGSGKTAVFVKLIEYILGIGKQAIMLVPEIALTPQMVGRFKSLFGETVAVIHSNLSLTQRMREYNRILNGEARIAVGTRSAVFVPFREIGLIIIDEEGEHTYKSEASPRYHAREIAKKRCTTHNAVLLMASATPSMESYYYAQIGRYTLYELNERYASAALPEVSIVDMADVLYEGGSSTFSKDLLEEIGNGITKKEQTILLINRRGYNTYISCPKCKEALICPSCNIPLTYHKTNNSLLCHYCGYSTILKNICEKCGSEKMKLAGVGTQRVESELQEIFPEARILRMDADTTYSRYAYEKNFTAFGNGEYDIMLGTQMIAKGLDFPNVTLVGVLSIDRALYSGDFRSYEQTFSLITQVVGRGGRGEKKGRAILQTYTPEHYIIHLAAMQDYKNFYSEEIALRKALIYPPFCDIFLVRFSGLVEKNVNIASEMFLKMMKHKLNEKSLLSEKFPLRVLGPSQCVHAKINDRYRYRIIIKSKNIKKFRDFMSQLLQETYKVKEFTNINVYIDINGDIGI